MSQTSRDIIRHALKGGFAHTLEKAGTHGVIARHAWQEQRTVLHVVNFHIGRDTTRITAVRIEPDRTGEYNPTDEDLRAIDWYVVSKAVKQRDLW